MAGPAPSAAAEELPGPAARRLYSRMEASCLELALEGERLCKAGDFKAGVAFFEAAVQVGTEDLKTLSAIYSQLGNAYFYLKEHGRALQFHRHDLLLARTIGDRIGEAKASGNLGNTLKVLGRFDEAVVCCQRHLDIAQEQGDKVGEARALYNIGNVYHAKGKQLCWSSAQDPGHLPPDVRETLRRASEFYERNLCLVKELGDRAAQGRAYGNLGNTHYLLGNFTEATAFHKERLAIAKEFGDKAAERRAYSNLGNAHIFLGRFDVAAEYYKKTLQLSRQLRDQAVEAQACYSLGNTYTLLRDHERAAEFHLRHLLIAQELADRVGEGRACWSLGNTYLSMGSPAQALTFAKKHLQISQEIGDRNGELTARMNVAQLQLALGPLSSPAAIEKLDLAGYEAQGARPKRTQRLSVEAWDLLRLSPEREQNGDACHSADWRGPGRDSLPLPVRSRKYQEGSDTTERRPREGSRSPLDSADVCVQVPRTSIPRVPSSDEECFFDLLSKFQSSRMDDQRCPLQEGQAGAAEATAAASLEERLAQPSVTASPQTEELFDLIASSQSRRLDDQRASVGSLPGLRITHNNVGHLRGDGDPQEPGDEFFNMLIKYQRRQKQGRGPGISAATLKPAPSKEPRDPRPLARTRQQLQKLLSPLLQALQRSPGAPQATSRPSQGSRAPRLGHLAQGGAPWSSSSRAQELCVPGPPGSLLASAKGQPRPSRLLGVSGPWEQDLWGPQPLSPRLGSHHTEQSSRINDQRCPPPDVPPRGPTMPDEDFFSLVQRVQAKRMDEQRVALTGSQEQEASGPPKPPQQCQPGAS